MKEDDITKGQMSITREKDGQENLGKCHLHSHLCSPSQRKIGGPEPETGKPGQCTDAETKGKFC